MKKPNPRKRSSKAKRKPITVEEYLASVPATTLSTFTKLRATVRSVVPADATETISYGIPAFRHNGILVWFAAFSNHCSLFPTASVLEEFKDELKGFSTSKGTVHFPNDQPLPVTLVKKLVRARVQQSKAKQQLR